MSNAKSRWAVVTFILLAAIPVQGAIMWTRPHIDGFDWLMLVFLLVLGWAHIDTPVPDED
ncbi:MAG: hypothetical protein M3Y22_07025 [Pseudomonadota bacterium]|nr:hypothetical protein [Pseudomonadota bacterium]